MAKFGSFLTKPSNPRSQRPLTNPNSRPGDVLTCASCSNYKPGCMGRTWQKNRNATPSSTVLIRAKAGDFLKQFEIQNRKLKGTLQVKSTTAKALLIRITTTKELRTAKSKNLDPQEEPGMSSLFNCGLSCDIYDIHDLGVATFFGLVPWYCCPS